MGSLSPPRPVLGRWPGFQVIVKWGVMEWEHHTQAAVPAACPMQRAVPVQKEGADRPSGCAPLDWLGQQCVLCLSVGHIHPGDCTPEPFPRWPPSFMDLRVLLTVLYFSSLCRLQTAQVWVWWWPAVLWGGGGFPQEVIIPSIRSALALCSDWMLSPHQIPFLAWRLKGLSHIFCLTEIA